MVLCHLHFPHHASTYSRSRAPPPPTPLPRPWYRLPVISFSYFKSQLYLKSNYLIMWGCLYNINQKFTQHLSYFRLPSQCKWDLSSSTMLRAKMGSYLPPFWDNLSAPSSKTKQTNNNVFYRRFGTNYRPHLQRPNSQIIMLFTDVLGQPIDPIFDSHGALKEHLLR